MFRRGKTSPMTVPAKVLSLEHSLILLNFKPLVCLSRLYIIISVYVYLLVIENSVWSFWALCVSELLSFSAFNLRLNLNFEGVSFVVCWLIERRLWAWTLGLHGLSWASISISWLWETVPVRDWSVGEAEIYCAGAIFIEWFSGDSVSLCLKWYTRNSRIDLKIGSIEIMHANAVVRF